jgi:hypothetical protein
MLKPATLAAIIDDLYEQPEADYRLVAKFCEALEESVGNELAASFAIGAGLDSALAYLIFDFDKNLPEKSFVERLTL